MVSNDPGEVQAPLAVSAALVPLQLPTPVASLGKSRIVFVPPLRLQFNLPPGGVLTGKLPVQGLDFVYWFGDASKYVVAIPSLPIEFETYSKFESLLQTHTASQVLGRYKRGNRHFPLLRAVLPSRGSWLDQQRSRHMHIVR